MITTCTAAKDYTGRIICPSYGEDCLSQSATDDDIFGEGYLCDAGQDVTYDICGTGETCSGETITTRTHIRCSGAACTTETETVANKDPDCTVQSTHKTGDTTQIPTDLPDVNNGWIDPHSCTSQSQINPNCGQTVDCTIDGPDSLTCLGRVDRETGLPDVEYNGCGTDSYYIYFHPGCGESDYVDDTSRTICTGLTISLTDEITLKCDSMIINESPDEDTKLENVICDGVSYELNCTNETYHFPQRTLPDGIKQDVYIDNTDMGDSGVTTILTINTYKDGTTSTTIRRVSEDGETIGVMTIDKNGNAGYCEYDTCTSDMTKKEFYENPTKTEPCEALQEVIQETIKTKQDEPPTTDRDPISIQVITETPIECSGGQHLSITDSGVLINGEGKVVDTTTTVNECSGGQIIIRSNPPPGGGDCPSYEGQTIIYPDGTATTTSTWTDPKTGQVKTNVTYEQADGTKIDVKWDGTIWFRGEDGESNNTQAGCVNSWNSLCGQGEVCGGTYNPSCHQCQKGSH
jgi:hypothetical protein